VAEIYHVLHVGLVTQCAMLEEFGIFLVLAEGVGVTLLPHDMIAAEQNTHTVPLCIRYANSCVIGDAAPA
jgi:hypothetical protein